MAGKGSRGQGLNWIFKGAFLNFTVLLVFCMFHPAEMAQQMATENSEHVLLIGDDTYHWVEAKGLEWYKETMEDTGIRPAVVKWFGRSLENPSWRLRLIVVFNAIQQFFMRCAWISIWIWPGMLVALAWWIDGIAQWKARKYSFAYASPRAHSWGKKAIYLVPVMLLTITCFPQHVSPAIIPAVFIMLAGALNQSAANMQKKL